MIKRKLVVAVFLIITAFCGVIGFAACGEQHVHTFSEDWMRSETEHWHEATCEHTEEKGDLGPHVDSDNNGKCDKCNYDMPTDDECNHTFESTWTYDGKTHWHAATCEHKELKKDEAPHVDENNDQFCDICRGLIEHEHKFSETEWKFDLDKHWRPATCGHTTEKGSEAEHTFTDGVCECGVKEVEKTAYNTLVEKKLVAEENDFYTWLTGLKTDGKEVRITAQGDIVYDSGEHIEDVYVAERTIKVKAAADGDGLADVWFKVAYDGLSESDEHSTNALAVAKSGADGIAEITFNPIGGYTIYNIMLAEAKDVAVLEGGEEAEIKVIPNRYLLKSSSAGTAVVAEVAVSENDASEDPLGTLEFEFSKSWEAYHTFGLPYARYYVNPLDNTSEIKDGDYDYTFTTSGDNLFDYFYFTPSNRYSFEGYEDATTEQKATIEENFKFAASGIYRISFGIIQGSANLKLYYWNEQGVEFTGVYNKKADGTPDDVYITLQSGSSNQDETFSGGDYVIVTVPAANGLRGYQLGLLSDGVCTVKITVSRTGESEIPTQSITVGNNDNAAYILTENGESTQFELVDVDADIYTLKVVPIGEETAIQARLINAYVNAKERSLIWNGSSYQGIIVVEEGTEFIYIQNGTQSKEFNISLEKYEAPTIKDGDNNLYATTSRVDIMPDVKPFEYTVDSSFGESIAIIKVTSYLSAGDPQNPKILTININGKANSANPINYGNTYTTFLTIKGGDKIQFSINEANYAVFMLKVNVEKQATAKLNEPFTISKSGVGKHYYAFAANGAGTYKLRVDLAEMPIDTVGNVSVCVQISDFNNPSRQITKTYTPTGEYFSTGAKKQKYQERFDEFIMGDDEIIVFEIQIMLGIESDVTFEFIKG